MSTLLENVAKVTAAHAALKTAIAAKGVTVPDGTKLTGMPALVEQIETGGTPEPNMPRAVFAGDTSASITVPSVMVVSTSGWTSLSYAFYNCGDLTSLTLPDGFGAAATEMRYCFASCYGLSTLTLPDGFGVSAGNIENCFFNCQHLATIHLPDGFGQSSSYNFNIFRSCRALTTITGGPRFKSSLDLTTSPSLTHDSIMVIINGLQTVTSSTLSLGSTNLAKLTDEEKKVATDKGWTLA